MATISKTGIVDGQIVYAENVTRIIDALDGTTQDRIIIDADLIQGNASNTTDGGTSHAEGNATNATGTYSHAEGTSTTASGDYSHAEGSGTSATVANAHAEGENTIASGTGAHAEGTSTNATGPNSHAEGGSTQAIGGSAHAEGYGSIAYGGASHAEGVNTYALGDYSHAEGSETLSEANYSHAEGRFTSASGQYSHAEGGFARTGGNFDHAEGFHTYALGGASHAEGAYTTASGEYSHAAGYYTVASGDYQSVIGQYNISSSDAGAFIVGNGIDDSNRSNLIYASGSTVQITGSLDVSGSLTGSLFGTASWAESASVAISSSYALSASYAPSNLGTGTVNNVPRIATLNGGNIATLQNSAITDNGVSISIGRIGTLSGSGMFSTTTDQKVTSFINVNAWDPNAVYTTLMAYSQSVAVGTRAIVANPGYGTNTLLTGIYGDNFGTNTNVSTIEYVPTSIDIKSLGVTIGKEKNYSYTTIQNTNDAADLRSTIATSIYDPTAVRAIFQVRSGSATTKRLIGALAEVTHGGIDALRTGIYGADFATAQTISSIEYLATNINITSSQVAIGSVVVLAQVSQSLNFANDTAAAAGGVPLGGLYRSGSFVLIRLV